MNVQMDIVMREIVVSNMMLTDLIVLLIWFQDVKNAGVLLLIQILAHMLLVTYSVENVCLDGMMRRVSVSKMVHHQLLTGNTLIALKRMVMITVNFVFNMVMM